MGVIVTLIKRLERIEIFLGSWDCVGNFGVCIETDIDIFYMKNVSIIFLLYVNEKVWVLYYIFVFICQVFSFVTIRRKSHSFSRAKISYLPHPSSSSSSRHYFESDCGIRYFFQNIRHIEIPNNDPRDIAVLNNK